MKWIKFSDIKPTVGMYIFVVGKDAVNIIRWEKSYEDDDNQYISVYDDTWPNPCRIWDLDAWAPVSFFNEYLPALTSCENISPECDWYIIHKDHPNIKRIIETSEESSKNKLFPGDFFLQTTYGGMRYDGHLRRKCSQLFEQIIDGDEVGELTETEKECLPYKAFIPIKLHGEE